MRKEKEVTKNEELVSKGIITTKPRSGSELRAWREKHDLTRLQLAKQLGVSMRTIIRYEKSAALRTPVALAMKVLSKQSLGEWLAGRGSHERGRVSANQIKALPRSGVTVSIRIGHETRTVVF